MAFIICYLVTRNLYTLLWFTRFKGLEFYHLPLIAINTFFFYFFEWINNLWWLVFIIHLVAVNKPSELNEKLVRKLWLKEMTLLTICLVIAVSCITMWVVIMSYSLYADWDESKIYFIQQKKMNKMWKSLDTTTQRYTLFLFVLGISASIFKLIIGVYMLKIMKKKLKLPYENVKKSIKVTMIATIVILTLNFVVNYLDRFSENLWIFYTVPVEKMSPYLLILKFFDTLINSIAESFLICYTAENIDFRYYILVLCEGRRRLKFAPHISIFLHFRPNLDCSMNDSDSENNYNSRILQPSLMEDIRNNTDNSEPLSWGNPDRTKIFSSKSYITDSSF